MFRICTIVCIVLLSVAAPLAHAADTSERYSHCTDLARSSPSASLAIADKWLQEAPVPSAYHCRAISLFALRRYHEAGNTLEQLAGKIGPDASLIWANVMRQTAKAWQLAGDKAKAIVTLTQTIQTLSGGASQDATKNRTLSDLLADRSKLYADGSHTLYAIQDLDHALSLTPQNDMLLLARAELLLQQGAKHQSLADVNRILATKPGHVPAQELKQKILSAM